MDLQENVLYELLDIFMHCILSFDFDIIVKN